MLGYKKFKKRARLTFTDGVKTAKGLISEIAEDLLVVTCRKPLPRGTWLELTVDLPEGRTGRVKAKVMVAIKPVSNVTDGSMEMEVTLYNKAYADFLRSVVGDMKGNDLSLLVKPGDFPGDADENAPAEETPVAPKAEKFKPEPKPEPEKKPAKEVEYVILECGFCGTKNKVPEDRILDGPICAMCKEPLLKTS